MFLVAACCVTILAKLKDHMFQKQCQIYSSAKNSLIHIEFTNDNKLWTWTETSLACGFPVNVILDEKCFHLTKAT